MEKEDKAGLYLTIIFHLVLIIVFLLYSINLQVSKETSFVLDFTKYEELEKQKQQEQMAQSVSEELDRMIAAAKGQTPRNVVVDASTQNLKDDRHSNPNEVYDEARRLQERLNASKREALKNEDSPDDIAMGKSEDDSKKEEYKGPSVLSYSLDGRKMTRKPRIPAYKCYGGGDIAVSIIVDKNGKVIQTKIIEEVSSADNCLREEALRAAKLSRFEKSKDKERQAGEIIFRFLPQ